jgi:hypothetical protein
MPSAPDVVVCPNCNGTGLAGSNLCEICEGKGKVEKGTALVVVRREAFVKTPFTGRSGYPVVLIVREQP